MSKLQDYIFVDENHLNGFERKAYNQMIEEIGEDVLDKYNYKLATFWHMINLDEKQIQHLHPIVFTYGINRNHFLPNDVLCYLNPDQIYAVLKGTNKSFSSIEDYIIRIWVKTCQEYSFNMKYLSDRNIPIWKTYTEFPKNVNRLYQMRKIHLKAHTFIKPSQFYLDTNAINIKDFFVLIDNVCPIKVSLAESTIHNYKIFDEVFESERIMNYKKTLEILNQNYGYRKLTHIENALSLNDVSRKSFLYYYNHYFKEDREIILKRIIYIFEYRKETNKIPHIQLSERKFVYFLNDVIDYINKTIIK